VAVFDPDAFDMECRTFDYTDAAGVADGLFRRSYPGSVLVEATDEG
jgi:hypothetical protein